MFEVMIMKLVGVIYTYIYVHILNLLILQLIPISDFPMILHA